MGSPLEAEVTCDPKAPLSGGDIASRFRAIYGIGRELLAQKEPQQVIRAVHRAIVENLKPDHACVLALGPNGSHRPLAAHNLDLTGAEETWPLSHTVLRRARETGLAVLAADTLADAALATGSVQRLEIRSVMCVPLGQKTVRGLAYLDNRKHLDHPFTRDDLEFLTAVSAYASLVLERAEEYAQATEALRVSDERLELLQGELLRHRIVGRSASLLAAYDTVKRFARTGARVMLRGETGTGKELFARAYAAESARRGAYVPVPIPALAPTLVESELFGHVRGAFTEATRDKKGRLELAHGGVLFLDEIGDIEPALQPKLLRFLDSGELYRVGDTEARFVDALVVSATNRLLEKDVEAGRFRADLVARLGHVVTIPPLRERPEDIPVLVAHFLDLHGRAGGKTFADETLDLLKRHHWPLNVRELQQVVERACCLVDRDVVRPEDLPDYIGHASGVAAATAGPAESAPRRLRDVVDAIEKAHILKTLEFTKGNRRRAIELLEVSPDTFYKRLEEFGIRKKDSSS